MNFEDLLEMVKELVEDYSEKKDLLGEKQKN